MGLFEGEPETERHYLDEGFAMLQDGSGSLSADYDVLRALAFAFADRVGVSLAFVEVRGRTHAVGVAVVLVYHLAA
jgi:hypothetical protein